MRSLSPLAAFFIFAATPALAQAPLELRPNESVMLRFDDQRRPVVIERIAAEWTPFELAMARRMVGGQGVDIGGSAVLRSHEGMPSPPEIRPGVVRLRFFQIAGRHAILFLENGAEGALVYRATMSRNGRQEPTDVCLLPTGRRGNEHWPYPIDSLALSDLRLIEWNDNGRVPCS